jgi:pimeloyl-ACP methyl ester carboxylesterase
MTERIAYDEFAYFADNASENGIAWRGDPAVRRVTGALPDGRSLSALRWGTGDPEIVLVHGGGQNAHTWDTVALALDRPLLAVDLPGHGHSDVGSDGSIRPAANAADLAAVIAAHAPSATAIVGMSLGGLSSIALLDIAPDLVRRLLLVDITPGVTPEKAKGIADFVNGPASFDSFGDLLARTVAFNPTRSEASLRRGILHNAVQRDDGSWVWRYRRFTMGGPEHAEGRTEEHAALWGAIGRSTAPIALARGMRKGSVVDDADVAELLRLRPDATVVEFADAGHSVQGDMPVELAAMIATFAGFPTPTK